MKRFLSSCARLSRVGFAVALDALPSLPTSKQQTLAIVLLTVAVAAGVMGRNASAGIVTATLNQTATDGSPVYFSYASGTIGTLDQASTGNSSIQALVVIRRAETGQSSAPKTGHRVGGIGWKNRLVRTCLQGA